MFCICMGDIDMLNVVFAADDIVDDVVLAALCVCAVGVVSLLAPLGLAGAFPVDPV